MLRQDNQAEQVYSLPTISSFLKLSYSASSQWYVTVKIMKQNTGQNNVLPMFFIIASDQGYLSQNDGRRKWHCDVMSEISLIDANQNMNNYTCATVAMNSNIMISNEMENANVANMFSKFKNVDSLRFADQQASCAKCTLNLCKYSCQLICVNELAT